MRRTPIKRFDKDPTSEEEEIPSSAQVLWSKWHWWIYLLLILASAFALAEAYLEPVRATSTIARSTQFEVNFSTKRSKSIVPYSVVTMANGCKFQVPGGSHLFPVGDTLLLELTPLWKQVVRYTHPRQTRWWNELAPREKEYDLFPAVVLLCSLLLLIPFRAAEPRWLLHSILALVAFAWFITMIGMGGLKPWG